MQGVIGSLSQPQKLGDLNRNNQLCLSKAGWKLFAVLGCTSQDRKFDWRKDTLRSNIPLNLPRSSRRCTYSIAAKAGTEFIEALPDTGAQFNIISAHLAQKLRLEPKSHTERLIQLPTGGDVLSPGCLKVPFSFRGEKKVTNLTCFILPHISHDLVLSGAFLRATETLLTKYKSRITAAVRQCSKRLGLRLIGNERRCLHGLIDGQPVEALPDTGSDVMIMSEAYALSRGFNIDRNLQNFINLELADGSEVFTCGLVRGVDWTFAASRQSVKCDFYVLEDLCTDVVLNNDFLFGLDVFSTELESLSELSYSEDYSELLLISLKGYGPAELPPHEDPANIDLTSADAFSRQRVLAELHHRDEVDNLIDALDPDDQETARRTELERRKVWDVLRQRHQQLQVAAQLNGSTSPMTAPTQDTHNDE
ncbi:hypothetical protein CNYM01_02566 [Colletotrichum nymphaeae SA-01]|uniref:Uncharacterized protein n=1 Tax=Colletotrichum nymphaeae SA-01 TaxID=1460502 RepID=A0A135TIN4_9PEZI|nr:hypothetical protein CNYM01_02566 [Colletotrichum nymphaeae SA-01]